MPAVQPTSTYLIKKTMSTGKKAHHRPGLQDLSSTRKLAISTPSSNTTNTLSLHPSVRRPVKLPLRKHHTFHFQSSQTVSGAFTHNQQHQFALSTPATFKMQTRKEGPLLCKQLNQKNGFKPITPVPMSPSQPLTEILLDDLILMKHKQKHTANHNATFGHCESMSRKVGVNIRRHTSNVEDFSRFVVKEAPHLLSLNSPTHSNTKHSKHLHNLISKNTPNPYSPNEETQMPTDNVSSTINHNLSTPKNANSPSIGSSNMPIIETQYQT